MFLTECVVQFHKFLDFETVTILKKIFFIILYIAVKFLLKFSKRIFI